MSVLFVVAVEFTPIAGLAALLVKEKGVLRIEELSRSALIVAAQVAK